jgi:DNA-binding NarL/FixJ family response regulator
VNVRERGDVTVREALRRIVCLGAASQEKMNTIFRSTDPSHVGRAGRAARVVIADDECMFRASLRHLLAVPPSVVRDVYGVDVGDGFEVVGEASSGEETIETVGSARPDLLLLDLSMPRLSGLDALRVISTSCETTRTIILSGELDKSQLLMAVQLGARGVVLKNSATELLFEAMTRVIAGQSWVGPTLIADLMDVVRSFPHQTAGAAPPRPFGLTPREREVLSLVVEAATGNYPALRGAGQTPSHRMFDKVGAANRVELALTATRNGLINEPSTFSHRRCRGHEGSLAVRVKSSQRHWPVRAAAVLFFSRFRTSCCGIHFATTACRGTGAEDRSRRVARTGVVSHQPRRRMADGHQPFGVDHTRGGSER